ncbi:uncharacterized protein LOC116598612 [Mustela erminea]|uniref:uncharacterized protein LOC116598612 n=1 Tax=Mustela erminea TaxID=36723 RepID=UPI001386F9F7|nr:uncharacterized protein LOC116598612 [Mustela erminea]
MDLVPAAWPRQSPASPAQPVPRLLAWAVPKPRAVQRHQRSQFLVVMSAAAVNLHVQVFAVNSVSFREQRVPFRWSPACRFPLSSVLLSVLCAGLFVGHEVVRTQGRTDTSRADTRLYGHEIVRTRGCTDTSRADTWSYGPPRFLLRIVYTSRGVTHRMSDLGVYRLPGPPTTGLPGTSESHDWYWDQDAGVALLSSHSTVLVSPAPLRGGPPGSASKPRGPRS